jgi:hypothetical protein
MTKRSAAVKLLTSVDLVPEKGVEPSTFSLRMSCSTN